MRSRAPARHAHERLIALGSVWVAEAEPGTLIGFASAEVFGDELHRWELSVHADWQQQGGARGCCAKPMHMPQPRGWQR